MTLKAQYCGIDYSVCSPAATIINIFPDDSEYIEIICHSEELKENIHYYGEALDIEVFSNPRRIEDDDYFKRLAWNALSFANSLLTEIVLDKYAHVAIEDYSMGSKGRITGIAECTGVFKNELYKAHLSIIPYAPKTIKKFFTGNGNADKQKMFDALKEKKPIIVEAYIELAEHMKKKKIRFDKSPFADLTDSYAIAEYIRFMKEKKND